MWKWDQGRLQYSKLENTYKIASILCELEGAPLDDEDDHLKELLIERSGLPFKPDHYTAWRNYARTIKALGLASKIEGKLKTTELCKRLASNKSDRLTSDDYLTHLTKVFSYPAPCFKDYEPSENKIFPIAAIIKYLLAKGLKEQYPTTNAQEVSSVLIGNDITGIEPITSYQTLIETGYTNSETGLRHIRELLQFISQFSFLLYSKGELSCDMQCLSHFNQNDLDELFEPVVLISEEDKEIEVQQIFNLNVGVSIDAKNAGVLEDVIFTEGKKVRTNHLRTERSRQAIKAYFDNAKDPNRCGLCGNIVSMQYPWMDKLIEVHHLLPLASPLHNGKIGTSITDLVGLCPNCHRATHSYYRKFLKEHDLDDFIDEEQAKNVYQQLKNEFQPL
ncbi:HNH endonuclease [Vibrio crassostreae]|uniref:HNH endonuclease n=1 Tax=Vibrio crassostreae TaxID=246167 RepID=UPI001B308F3F|nr:HNH endonuclease [Vibrio crassostreae]